VARSCSETEAGGIGVYDGNVRPGPSMSWLNAYFGSLFGSPDGAIMASRCDGFLHEVRTSRRT